MVLYKRKRIAISIVCLLVSGFGLKSDREKTYNNDYWNQVTLDNRLPLLIDNHFIYHPKKFETIEEKVPEKYGVKLGENIAIQEGKVKRGDRLYKIIGHFSNVNDSVLRKLSRISMETFDLRHLNIGKNYSIIYNASSNPELIKFIYESSPEVYIDYDFRDTLSATRKQRPVQLVEKTIKGTVDNTLYWSIMDRGGPVRLTAALFDIFAWSFDFNKISRGDEFKVIYEEKYVNGESIGLDKVLAAWYKLKPEAENADTSAYYAFYFDQGTGPDYFDEDGNNLRKAPLSFDKISSYFSRARFHTVQYRYKAHKGVDLTGPEGRPVRAIDDGTVISATYSRNNGNFVKIDHGSYQSQYLHFSLIEPDLKKGDWVEKGERIGYLGSTGLASGPHVCFRIWKNNRQVDPLGLAEIPFPDPVKASNRNDFMRTRDLLKSRLDAMYLGPDIFSGAMEGYQYTTFPMSYLAPHNL